MMNRILKKRFVYLLLLAVTILLYGRITMGNELEKGIELFELRKYAEAKEIFKSCMEDNPGSSTTIFYLGRIYLVENNAEQAIASFERAIKLDETNSDYHLWLGRALVMKMQRVSIFKRPAVVKNMKKEFKRAIELNPGNLDARFGLLQFYTYAPGFMGGSQQEADEQAEEIRKRDIARGHLALGLIYQSKKQDELAEQEFLAAIKEKSETFQAYYQLAYLYSAKKQYDKSFEILKRLVTSYPQEIDAYYHVGKIADISGKNLDKAEVYLKKYLTSELKESSPSKSDAHYLLGAIFEKKGEKESARSEYEKAIQLNPGDVAAKKALEVLK